jgi:hypothetical protein
MPSITWTPDALRSEFHNFKGRVWRLVEAQHLVSTMKLVDRLDEQQLLEELLDESKRAFPSECDGLDYLLKTPFRYNSTYPHGSRFRRAGLTKGVYYAALSVTTALAEMVFYRLLFYAESPQTSYPDRAADYTAFAASISTAAAIDLTKEPLSRDEALWLDPSDYEACQQLEGEARLAGAEAILYRSVRDASGGRNIALLEPRGFASKAPLERKTWRLHFKDNAVQALCEHPKQAKEFQIADFAADPRIKPLIIR